jgi:hypothetical protein
MTNEKLILFSLFFSIIFSASAFAFPAIASIPPACAFYGKVKLGDNYVNGTLVTAYINDTDEYLSTAEEVSGFGNYSVTIDNATNYYVKFKIAGIDVDQTEKLCLLGNVTYLDLTATPLSDGSSCTQNEQCSSNHCVHNVCRATDPYDGDGYCDAGENCANSIDCPCSSGQICDAGACTTPSGPLIVTTLCEENWTCSEWSDCLNEIQTRICTDLNDCGTNNSKPTETQDCVVPVECVENWTCSEWSTCFNKMQNRACIDLNNCGTQKNKPEETQRCEVRQPVQTTEAPTGLFAGLNAFDLLTASILGLAFLSIILFILKRRKPKSKRKRK